jgi:hypothetical protein
MMKKFIFKISWFALPIVLIAFPLDILLSHYLKKSNQYPGEFEVWNDIYTSRAECEVAVYGSSRAWVQINPTVLGDSLQKTVYNFGIDGHNFWLQYLRHKELLKFNKQPKLIVLSVDILTLQKVSNLYQLDQFLPYMLYNKSIAEFTSSYTGYKQYDYYLPLIRYSGKTDALHTLVKIAGHNQELEKYRNKGFRGMDKVWSDDFDKAKKQNQSIKLTLHKPSLELFENFINEVKQLGITLVLVYCPEYIEGQAYVSNRSDLINLYTDYATKHNLVFLDYSNDKICTDKNLFYNAMHLNSTGADFFSKKLAHDLKRLKESE